MINCIFRFLGSESFLSCNRCNDLQLSALNSRSICDATCSSGRTRLCGGCTSFSPCTRSCISQCLFTSLLLKLALIRSYYLYNDYWRWSWSWSSRQFSYWETSKSVRSLSKAADKTISQFEVAFLFTLKDICSRLQYSPPREKRFLMLETFPYSTTQP